MANYYRARGSIGLLALLLASCGGSYLLPTAGDGKAYGAALASVLNGGR